MVDQLVLAECAKT